MHPGRSAPPSRSRSATRPQSRSRSARKVRGRLVKHHCVAARTANAKARACTRTVRAGTIRHTFAAGRDRFRFSGTLAKHRTLSAGRYTVSFRAAEPGYVTTAPASLRFSIG